MLTNRFSRRVARNISFIAATFMCLTAGSLYMFSAYSHEMSVLIGRGPVEIVGSMGDLGLYLGLTMGLFQDRFGPQWTTALATAVCFGGYSLVLITLNSHLVQSIGLLCVYYFLIGQGSYAMFISSYSTTIKNFPVRHKGKLAGYFLAVYGFGSVLYTLVFKYIINSDIYTLFLLMIIAVTSSNLFGIFFLGLIPPDEDVVPVNLERTDNSVSTSHANDDLPLLKNNQKEDEEGSGPVTLEITGIDLIKNLDFWLIFLSFTLTAGGGLMWKNVLGSVNTAFNLSVSDTMVITWSIVNTVIRVAVGYVSDTFSARVPRPLWLVILLVLMFVTHVSFLFAGEKALWPINLATGIGYGGAFAMANGLVAIYYGTKHIGINSGLTALAPAIGGTSFTYICTQLTKAQIPPDQQLCTLGSVCFYNSFWFSSSALLISIILSIWLTIRHYRYHMRVVRL